MLWATRSRYRTHLDVQGKPEHMADVYTGLGMPSRLPPQAHLHGSQTPTKECDAYPTPEIFGRNKTNAELLKSEKDIRGEC